jgi:hypothetical protein
MFLKAFGDSFKNKCGCESREGKDKYIWSIFFPSTHAL